MVTIDRKPSWQAVGSNQARVWVWSRLNVFSSLLISHHLWCNFRSVLLKNDTFCSCCGCSTDLTCLPVVRGDSLTRASIHALGVFFSAPSQFSWTVYATAEERAQSALSSTNPLITRANFSGGGRAGGRAGMRALSQQNERQLAFILYSPRTGPQGVVRAQAIITLIQYN